MVLDTNVLLDWLVFRDSRCAWLGPAIESERATWCATKAMLGELEHVLTRSEIINRHADPAATTSTVGQWAQLVEPAQAPSPNAMRCTDSDDQMFIDLVLQLRPATLLSRDRAVLRLARQALQHGVSILAPDAAPRQLRGKLSD